VHVVSFIRTAMETRTQDSFRVYDFSSCGLLSENNKFCLGGVLFFLVFGLPELPREDWNPKHFSMFWRLFLWSSWNKQVWVWSRSSVMFSIRTTEIIFAGNRTQDNFSVNGFLFPQSLRNTALVCAPLCYRAYFLSCLKRFHRDPNSGHCSGVLIFLCSLSGFKE
jgi:hypothetical protein